MPGGRLSSGEVSNILEVYDPRLDRWEQRASLPFAVSAYALAAFEGKLYLFGGWDGQNYLASTYDYDPVQDTWQTRSAMATARGFAGAAIDGGKIYVIGGHDGKHALEVNEEYLPEQDNGQDNPWTQRAPLPEGRYAMAVASAADIIHVIGGKKETGVFLPPIEYFQQRNVWQPLDSPLTEPWAHLGVVSVGTRIYTLGGKLGGASTGQNLSYQAIYTIFIPVPISR